MILLLYTLTSKNIRSMRELESFKFWPMFQNETAEVRSTQGNFSEISTRLVI